ncbi:MAG: YbhN family protein [Acidimicrobiales bacterium]
MRSTTDQDAAPRHRFGPTPPADRAPGLYDPDITEPDLTETAAGAGTDRQTGASADRPAPPAHHRHWWQSPLVRIVAGLVVMTAAFVWGLPAFASYAEVGQALSDVDTRMWLLLAATGAANLTLPSVAQAVAVPGLRLRHAVLSDWTTSAISNLIPGGGAIALGITWTMYRSWSVPPAAISRAVVVTGVFDVLIKLIAPLAGVIWLATEGQVGPGMVQATLIGLVLFLAAVAVAVTVLAGPGLARWLGHLLDRLPLIGTGWPDRLSVLRSETIELLHERGIRLTGWTAAGHLSLYILLLVCVRAVGIDRAGITAAEVFAALAFGRLVAVIPITPGGLGVMEVGLTSALVAVGTADKSAVVAAVLVFRSITFAGPIPLGLISWLIWSVTTRHHPQHAPDAGER